MPASELAHKIMEALNSNRRTPLDTTQDIHVGPLVFRYGGGPKQDRWYVAEDPAIGVCEKAGGHDYPAITSADGYRHCQRPGCGYRYNAAYWGH